MARRVVGDAVFDLGRQVDAARRTGVHLTLGIGVEQQLFDLAAVAHGHGVEAAVAGVAQQTDVLDRKAQRHGPRPHLDRRAVAHGEEAQGVVGLVGRDQQGLRSALDRESVTDVQPAGLARRNLGQARPRQVEDLQPGQTRRRHQTMTPRVGVQHDHPAARLAGRAGVERRGHDRCALGGSDDVLSRRGNPACRHRQHQGAGPKKIVRQSPGHGRPHTALGAHAPKAQ
ncbi:hypothetical protein D3C72_1280190 [compost metagenome]